MIEDELNDTEAKDEAERKRLGDLRNQQVVDEEAQKVADKLARRQALQNTPVLKAIAKARADKIRARKAQEQAEAQAKAQAEADAKAQAEAEAIAQAQAEADAKVQAEAEAIKQAQALADAKAQALPMIADELTKLNISDDDAFENKTKPLYGAFKEDFNKDIDNLKTLLSYLTDAEYVGLYDDLESKFPTKLASAKGNNQEAKVKNFLKQSTLDKYLGLQEETQQKSVDAFNKRLSQSNSPYEQRVAELGNMKLKDLKPIALEKTGKSTYPTKADTVKAILMKEFPSKTGNGFKLKRRIVGRGLEEGVNDAKKSKETVNKKIINGKYIDLNKLENNIICIRYCKTRALVPNVKVQHISNGVKEIIDDVINDKFEKRLYEKLDMNEKRLVKRIVDCFKLDIDTSSKDEDEYQRQFDICLGEWKSGSTSPLLKNKLKQYITESMESGMLPRRECFKLLFELANS
jgi:hypothetical protein